MGFFNQHRQLGNVQHTQPVGAPIPVASAPAAPAAPFNYNAPLITGGVAPATPAAPFNYNAPLLHPMNSVPGLAGGATTQRRPLLEAALNGNMRSGWLGMIQSLMLKARQEGKL